MKKEQILYKLTGTENPKFLTDRENKMVDVFLGIVNDLEQRVAHPEIIPVGCSKADDSEISIFSYWKEGNDIDPYVPTIKHFQ